MRHLRPLRPLLRCAPLIVFCACPGSQSSTSTGHSASDSESTGSTSDTTTAGTETEGVTISTGGGSITDTDTDTDTDSDSGDTDDTMPGMCGDFILDEGEDCDDGNLISGDGCEPDCTLTPASDDCGDNKLDPDEACDGDVLPIQDCAVFDENYTGGELSCAENCSFDTSACEICEAPGEVLSCDSESDELLHALGLACNTLGVDFSGTNNHIPVANFDLQSPDSDAYRVITQFGSHMVGDTPTWGPREGSKLLVISTGNLPQPDNNGVIIAPPGSAQTGITPNDNPNDLPSLPGIMHHQKGSNNGQGGTPFLDCDGINDCSDTLGPQWNIGVKTANDVFYLQFDVAVPKGTHGFNVDFAFFSAEYPEWVNTSFNDMAVLWSTSETYTGNITFITDQGDSPRPLTVTSLAQNGLIKYKTDSPELAHTGFDGEGGSSGWATVKGSALPEETLTLAWTVFDKGDDVLDTALLIDNWRWDCAGCVPSEVKSCGIIPQ